ncbi:2-succinyl-6-hydroxy-2,4-cyclohexadiene-1-carboxylate synthase [Bacillus sp. 03113]|uniref:2-succinyl-6-hydroxy-2, 4-cyclohexadiene-1-carboxylate synthase n=1 Tax=Bacillus sp. 03113 TaxID=2578211 RepID=UPI0011425B89|nr:2-succinyl-6-hydroxy-2,4-cyclohexadiene-1-carboxylate synthase [Bacillus sp. 03113]
MNMILRGIRYHVECFGDGFPLLLLHGFTGDSSTWTSFYDQWGKHSTVISLDVIGHGTTESPVDVEKYDILSVAKDLFELLENLKINKVDLLGYSMGGRLALTFALQYPHKVRKLILESATAGIANENEREQRRMKDHQLGEFLQENGVLTFVDYWEEIPLFTTQKRLSSDKRAQIREQRLNNKAIGLINSLKGMGTGAQPSWWEKLESVTCEVLLVTGSLDLKFCQIAEKMKGKMALCQWITVEDCGHAIHVEEPKKFGTIISEFLVQ